MDTPAHRSERHKHSRHDDNACECHEDMNDRFGVGSIEISEGADHARILGALSMDGYIGSASDAQVEDTGAGDGDSLDIKDEDGRMLYVLEKQENES